MILARFTSILIPIYFNGDFIKETEFEGIFHQISIWNAESAELKFERFDESISQLY